jgi:hypothetical protein
VRFCRFYGNEKRADTQKKCPKSFTVSEIRRLIGSVLYLANGVLTIAQMEEIGFPGWPKLDLD